MIQEDTYKTITDIAEGIYTEKRSKFIAIAIPVRTIEEIKQHLDTYQKKYYDARHVCYAYMLGHERKDFRANDNGEPSGTAGKPILGQINSNELTDILIIVVRYFGGIKLGTSGLIVAYKAAAAEAIAAADIVERTVDEEITVSLSTIDTLATIALHLSDFLSPLSGLVRTANPLPSEPVPHVVGISINGSALSHDFFPNI